MKQRILFVITHYFNPQGNGSLGSLRNDPSGRAQAVGRTITALHDLFNDRTFSLDFRSTYITYPANTDFDYQIDVVVLTTQGMTIFDHLTISPDLFEEKATDVDPTMLGFCVNPIFQERSGAYDWYVYLEDDIILHDPWLFLKLQWFESQRGYQALLLPNRYEVTERDGRGKLYIDGDLVPDQVALYRNTSRKPKKVLEIEQCDYKLHFCLAPNPHAGCHFLSQAQLDFWMQKPWFLETDTRFVRSFESAATLGILKTFDVYKPDLSCASFLEVQHFGEVNLAEMLPCSSTTVLSNKTQDGMPKPLTAKTAELKAQVNYLEQQLRQIQTVPLAVKNEQLTGEIKHLAGIVKDQTTHIDTLHHQMTQLTPMKEFSISAIIPLYNGESYIQQAISSVINQTLPPTELIIVNDGSTDQSVALIEKIKSPIPIHLVHQKNAGQSAARNHGARLAKGNIFAFLDQDDCWYPNHLQRLAMPFQSNPRVGWAYSDVDEIDRESRLITQSYLQTHGISHPKRSLIAFIGQDLFILPSTCLVAKTAFEQVGGFDEQLSGCEDDDLFLRLFLAGYEAAWIPESLSQWRIRHDSASSSERMFISRGIFAQKLIAMFPDEPLLARYYCRDCIAPRFYNLALREYQKFLILRQWSYCLKNLERMQFYHPLLRQSLLGLIKRRLRHILMRYPQFYSQLHQVLDFVLP